MVRFVGYAALCLGAMLIAARPWYPENTPLGHTGGFGEPTCLACHFDGGLNEPGGALRLSGVSETVRPGTTYTLTLSLHREEMARGGFQLSVRGPDGKQAGNLQALNASLVIDTLAGIQYARHTYAAPLRPEADRIVWKMKWLSPPEKTQAVFHMAANAANGDVSEFGDFIYAGSRAVRVQADK